MITGKTRDKFGTETTWELTPNITLIVENIYLGLSRKFNAEGITRPDQVIYLIDNEITEVKEWQIEQGPWIG
jgi:hypothetical protein